MTRRAFTVVELVVVLLLGAVALIAAWNVIMFMTRSEKSMDRASTRALVHARMLQYLMMDVHSSRFIDERGKEYVVERYVRVGDRLDLKRVTWKQVSDLVVTRKMEGQPVQEFSFKESADASFPRVDFKLERMRDAIFKE
jgi:type II secretory pathway component PulJ